MNLAFVVLAAAAAASASASANVQVFAYLWLTDLFFHHCFSAHEQTTVMGLNSVNT